MPIHVAFPDALSLEEFWGDKYGPRRSTGIAPDRRNGNATALPMPLLAPAEVRVSLLIDESLGWMLPVQFSIGFLLTATEVIEKIANAVSLLEAWSSAHLAETRANLRFEPTEPLCGDELVRLRRKLLIQ
jgi:hypothetical protein